ncbi:uncharacterized protein LOC129590341 [Paramacrobiotus metropolitanus]|uniref:uncharacterized protein LOC129590341 n=1 Tax=Paramacrobiotus metropolitanus TaxID=2943436 RepID=UPI00244630C4|nr:uncharacterized protein LOC129590341 [Paramacrobiotus metropolitanus]
MRSPATVIPVLLLLAASWADKPRRPKPGTIPLTPEQLKQQPKFIATHRHRAVGAIPECFDAREKWSQCKSISDIRDQGGCGSCWAMASASVLSDRICISELAAGKEPSQTYVSASYVASCSFERAKKNGQSNCNNGGSPANFFRWAATSGYITGGNYNSHVGCQPYPVAPDQHEGGNFTCTSTCTNPEYDKKTVVEDTALIDSYYVSPLVDPISSISGQEARTQERIDAQVLRIQTDILANGPVVASMNPYESLYKWKPETGPYRGELNQKVKPTTTTHSVRIVGWCKDDKGIKYWKILNSWGTNSGVPGEGELKFEMGKNVAEIEESIEAPIVSLPNTCAPICQSRLTQIIRQNPADLTSPIYAFFGNCVVKISINDAGQISLVNEPQPIGKVFVAAPAGPIVKWDPHIFSPQKGEFWIINPSGQAGVCTPVAGSSKFDCHVGSTDGNATASTVVGKDHWQFKSTQLNNFKYIFTYSPDFTVGSLNIGNKLTNRFTIVDTFLNIDGSTILVCGLDKQEKPACSTMNIATKEVTPSQPVQSVIASCQPQP